MTSCVRGGRGVSQKLTKPDKGRRGGQPKTDEVDFLLNKKLLLCSEEPDMGESGWALGATVKASDFGSMVPIRSPPGVLKYL